MTCTRYPDYSRVKYEFGYGLGYTTFEQSNKSIAVDEASGTVTANVTVTNAGAKAGKDVMQVYYEAPNGALNTPARELVAYRKTKELAPGESQALAITFKISDMASYDDNGKTGAENASCWLLEAGNFNIYVGSSVKDASLTGAYVVPQTRITERLTRRIYPTASFDRLVDPADDNRMESLASAEPVHGAAGAAAVDASASSARLNAANVPFIEQPERAKFASDADGSIFFKPANHGGVFKLTDVYYGNCTMEEFLAQMTVAEKAQLSSGTSGSASLNGQGGQGRIGYLARLGVPAMETNDGPAGLRLTQQTAWPIGTQLACTWNDELLERVGAAIGKEMDYSGPDVWLAPGMNIHRDPRCGRNFEYYSEDPVLCGKLAAAVSRGVHSEGGLVTLKHYSHNNQESSRSSSNSIASERASREIYLKGFEIAVKEGTAKNNGLGVMSIMSSYNLLNGRETAEVYDLISAIPDGEWGYNGLVMTDWGNNSSFVNEVNAGNDVKMSSGTVSQVQTALNNGTISAEQINSNMEDVMLTIMASPQFQRMLKVKDIKADGANRVDASAYNDYSGTVRVNVLTADDEGERGYRAGGGTSNGGMSNGDSVSYFLDVETGGYYDFRVRRASNASPYGAYDVLVDGEQAGALPALNTGGVQAFQTQDGPQLYLSSGEHILTFSATGAGASLNWLELERDAAVTETLTYDTVVDVLEWGSAVTAVVIESNANINASDVAADMFSVTAVTRNPINNNIVYEGPRTITSAYVSASKETGAPAPRGRYVVLELAYGYNNTTAEINGSSAIVYQSRNYWLNLDYSVEPTDKISEALDDAAWAKGDVIRPIFEDFTLTANPVEGYTAQQYRMHAPDGAGASGPLPLVLWNHGAGEQYGTSGSASNEGAQLFANMGGAGWVRNAPEDCFVLVPQRGFSSYSRAGVVAFIGDLVERGLVDGDRIYVSGCSAGGQETHNYLLENPELFAAAIPICPLGGSSLSAERLATIRKIPIWYVHAATDRSVQPVNSQTPYERLLGLNAKDVRRTLFPAVVGTEIPNEDYAYENYPDGHWSWVMLLNNLLVDDGGVPGSGEGVAGVRFWRHARQNRLGCGRSPL